MRFIIAYSPLIFLLLSQLLSAQITIASGNKSGNYYKLAQSIKSVLKENNISQKISVLESAGSTENLLLLRENRANLAIVQSDTAFYAQNGLFSFSNAKVSNVSTVMDLFTEPIFLLTNIKGINHIQQLDYQRVNYGPKKSGLSESAKVIINASGAHYIQPSNSSQELAINLLKAGSIEAMFTNHINQEMYQAILNKQLYIVPIGNDTINKLNSTYNCFFSYRYKINNTSDIETIATTALLGN